MPLIGIRQGLFFALRWEWVIWKQAGLRLPSYKRQKAFWLPLSTDAMALLRSFHIEQGRPAKGWIFPAPIQNSTRFNPHIHQDAHNWYNRTFKPLLCQLGMGHLTFHALRRTWATALGEHVPQRVLQLLGNWADSKVTERYARPGDSSLRAGMELVARSFGTAKKLPRKQRSVSPRVRKLLKNNECPRSSVG